jgi:L-2-hydroxyglutarate oxidase LhgO
MSNALELDPNVNFQVVAGILCTSSHIVDPVCLTNRLVESATLNGVKLFLEAKVEIIAKPVDLRRQPAGCPSPPLRLCLPYDRRR